ncbi:MAG: hypothetical protein IKR09_04995 [Alphaproteobacteria bacterium]|nr:hypothetical protein [Alphaproteobacteria bacterium]
MQKWQNGWILRTSKEMYFVAALLFLIPGYLIFWFIVYCFPLKKILLFPVSFAQNRKKAKLQAQSLAAAIGPADRIKAPVSKKEQRKAAQTVKAPSEKMKLINQLRGKSVSQHTATEAASPIAAGKDAPAQKNTPEQENASRFDLWEKFANSLESANIFAVRQITIKNVVFNLIAFTQNALFLIREAPEESASWETHDGDTPAVWKTQKGDIPSPLVPMIETRKLLQTYIDEHFSEYSNISLNFCMILDHGTITNPDAFLAFLEQNNLSALRMGSCKTTALPDSAALVEYIKSQPASSAEMNDAFALAFLDLMTEE